MSRSIGRSSQYQSYDDSDPVFLASHLAIILMIFFISFIFFIFFRFYPNQSLIKEAILLLHHNCDADPFCIFIIF